MSHSQSTRTRPGELVRVPFPGGDLVAVIIDGKPHVSIAHVCDALGIDRWTQQRKLNGKPWAVTVKMPLTAADGKTYESTLVDRRTLTMWLATISSSAVADDARPLLDAYQMEAADVLDRYFNEGGAINPRATDDQLGVLRQQAEIIQMFRGIIADDYLDSKARILLGRTLGETPQLDPIRRPLYVHDYLKEQGLSQNGVASRAPRFGVLMRAAYVLEHGVEPGTAPQEIRGRVVKVKAYTEADRPLFDRVWRQHFADRFELTGGAR